MRKDIALPVLALAGGGACLALRRWQLAAALDPETELFRSVPATPVLIGVLALLALLFGAQFGGFVTLVGVGSNASAASVMSELGYEPFGFFSITPFGIGVCILGTLYFLLVGTKLLPDTGYIPEFAKTEKKEQDKKKAAIAAVTMLCVLVVIAVSPDAVPMHVAATVAPWW